MRIDAGEDISKLPARVLMNRAKRLPERQEVVRPMAARAQIKRDVLDLVEEKEYALAR